MGEVVKTNFESKSVKNPLVREIESLGWQIRFGSFEQGVQAFFRGWQTEWRGSLEQVLADVKAYQEPDKNDE